MIYFAHCESPVGELMLAGDERHVSGLWMEGQKYFGATLPGGAVERENLPVFCAARQWLQDYLRGKNQSRRICRWLLRGERSGSLSGKFCWKFPMDRWLPTAGLQKRRPSVWAGQVCPARRWAVQWDTIPFPSSFPATGW